MYIKRLPPVVAMSLLSSIALCMLVPSAGNARETILEATAETPQPLFAPIESQIKLEVINPSDDWDRFVAEFGLDNQPLRLVINSIADAKYGVDTTLFSVAELATRLSHLLEINYSHGHFNYGHEAKMNPSQLARRGPFFMGDAQVKFDYALTNGKPYAGLLLVIPFGN